MLHALLEYAKQAEVIAKPGFKRKRVRWLLQFSASGEYLGLLPASDDRKGREFPMVPDLRFTSGTDERHFLVDTAQYLLLYEEGDSTGKLAKHRYALKLLRDAAEVEPVLERIADSLAAPTVRQRIHSDLAKHSPKARPSDNVTFVEMTDEGPRIIVEQTTWHDWWGSYWPRLSQKKGRKSRGKKAAMMRCFLSGELVEPELTHPKIKGLGDVDGNVPTTLVGFNCDAFRSYGLDQSANAAISEELAETYAAALNKLIATQSKRLAGAKVVYWYTHDVPREDDPLAMLTEGIDFGAAEVAEDDADGAAGASDQAAVQAANRAGELLDAIRTGQRPELRNCQYRALTLSGNAGRVVVRDWMEGQFEELTANVTKWFQDLSVVHRYGEGLARPPRFRAILRAMVRDIKEMPAPLEAALWRAAVTGRSIPFEAMARALARARIDIIQNNPPNHARMGLLKAYLIRKEICQMTEELNEYEGAPAYLCGRIMAILADIQSTALPGVGAGVVQRYYAAAGTTPALVLGRLVRLAQTGHLPKIEGGLRHWYDGQLAEVWARFDRRAPSSLTLEEQTLFAMGYYHQKAKRAVARDEDRPAEETAADPMQKENQ